MAYFAELNGDNIVLRVVAINNADLLDADGVEQEHLGIARCLELFKSGTWKKTSYNRTIRRNYAGLGYIYFEPLDVFVEPQPYSSWTFDTATANWVPPVPRPSVPDIYTLVWDEENQEWDAVINQGAT
jgi:hypothetical protein